MTTLVLDSTVLSHFARAGQLAALQRLVASYWCVVPAEVNAELLSGMGEHPALTKAVGLAWVRGRRARDRRRGRGVRPVQG